MKKATLLFLTIASGLLPELTPALSVANSPQGFSFTDKVVLAYYYIWFQEDNWLKPAASGGRREGLAGLHPLVGAYNSWDPPIRRGAQKLRILFPCLELQFIRERDFGRICPEVDISPLELNRSAVAGANPRPFLFPQLCIPAICI